jgi:hypothetical protein
VQIEIDQKSKTRKKNTKINLNMLHAQRKFWKLHSITYFYWSFFCVNDNQDVYMKHAQIMHCILCHNGIVNASNPKTQARKG